MLIADLNALSLHFSRHGQNSRIGLRGMPPTFACHAHSESHLTAGKSLMTLREAVLSLVVVVVGQFIILRLTISKWILFSLVRSVN